MKLLTRLFILVVMLTLTGCGGWVRTVANFTGHAVVCVDGVEYLQFTSGVTVKYLPDGKIATCKDSLEWE